MSEDIFRYIDVERTIAEFGYDPREKGHTKKKVIAVCFECKKTRQVPISNLKKSYEKMKGQPRCKPCAMSKNKTKDKPKVEISILKFCKIEKTIEVLGYDPRNLTRRSNKKVISFCPCCNQEKIVPLQSLGDTRILCKSCSTKQKNIKAFSVKECKGCRKEFSLYQNRKYCPDCSKRNNEEWLIKWKKRNPEKSSEYSRRYKEVHPGTYKKYYEENQPEIREKQRELYRQAAANRARAKVMTITIEGTTE